MFDSSTCFNATLRITNNLEDTNALTRIGRTLERFSEEKSVQALSICGVITGIAILMDAVGKTKFTEIQVDDGLDKIALTLPYSKFYELNMGEVIQVMVKNKLLSKDYDVPLYGTVRSEILGEVILEDMKITK